MQEQNSMSAAAYIASLNLSKRVQSQNTTATAAKTYKQQLTHLKSIIPPQKTISPLILRPPPQKETLKDQLKRVEKQKQAHSRMVEYEQQIYEIKQDLKNYNTVMIQAERFFKDTAVAEAYNEDWITDSDSQASVGKAQDFIDKQKSGSAMYQQSESREDYDDDYDDSYDDGYGGYDDSGNEGNMSSEQFSNNSNDNTYNNDVIPQNQLTTQRKTYQAIIPYKKITAEQKITDAFTLILQAGRGTLFEELIGWRSVK
ncbi:Hypothetical_protein [Hexamita inflata]|uniref:Hypothetical_protein n=1 Tax=Hexamita inflata TaxID=28002 RepID=A0AA86QEG4_9EUKA|nr:Hypothetical protein HINF_LOCUS39174 [Hexamita inflata]